MNHRNQQYSIIALTDGTGVIEERYAYSAYGEPTITNASGTAQSASAVDNRYIYTGREWDKDISLCHFRARMYCAESGRFCGRDPIIYVDGTNLYRGYFVPSGRDPLGKLKCEDFLAGEIDPTDWPLRAKNQWDRGAHVFCGSNCVPGGGLTWPEGTRCHICLDSNADSSERRWLALLIHELIHCDQDKCGRTGVNGNQGGPHIGDPVDPPKPPADPPANWCKLCRSRERNAYSEQCNWLFPEDKFKRRKCIEDGICFSCKIACKGVSGFERDCAVRGLD